MKKQNYLVFALALFCCMLHFTDIQAQCSNITNPGMIGANQSGCSPFDPAEIKSLQYPTGGSGTIEYVWLYRNAGTSNVFQLVSGANNKSYNPGSLTQTTDFRRCARRKGCVDYVGESNIITVTVTTCVICNNVTNPGQIGAAQTGCSPFDPALLQSNSLPSGGTGTLEYVWLYRNAGTNNVFQTIAGANGPTYDPGPITQTTDFRRCARRSGCTNYVGESNIISITVSNCCNATISSLVIYNIDNSTTHATLTNGATYYSGQLPANWNIEALLSGTSGESVRFTFSGGSTSSNIENTTPFRTPTDLVALNLAPGTYTLTASLFNQDNAAGQKCDEKVISFTILGCDNVTNAGQIGSSQSGCSPFDPALLQSISLPSGGTGTLEYVWIYRNASTNNVFQPIAGANGPTYDPSPITQTTDYRRCSRRSGCTSYVGESNIITITVTTCVTCDNVTSPGSIGPVQSGCSPFDPALIQSISLPSGGTGTLEYVWLYRNASTNNVFQPIAGANGPTYDPGPITQTTDYRRCARRSGCTSYVGESNIITITVTTCVTCDNVTSPGSIGPAQSGCSPFDPALIQSISLPSGGTGTLEYVWLYRNASTNNVFQPIASANGPTYDPGPITQTTDYRRCARRSGCTSYVGESNIITITVSTATLACTITGSNTICAGSSTILCAPFGVNAYLWSNGASTQTINVTTTGTYTVTITNAGGCTSSCSFSVTVNDPNDNNACTIDACNTTTGAVTNTPIPNCPSTCLLTVSAGNDQNKCLGESATLIATFNGASNCTTSVVTDCNHSLANSGGWLESTSYSTVCGDNLGTKLWTRSGNGSSYITLDFGSVVPAGTQICVRMKLEHCSNTSTSYSNAKIQASTSASTGFTDLTSSVTFTSTTFQDYCYTLASSARYVRVTDNGNCALRVDYVKYTTPGTVSSAVSYLWSTGATTSVINVTPAASTDYLVTVTDCNGCTAKDTVKVNVYQATCTINGSTICCGTDPVQLCVPFDPAQQRTYLWSTGETTRCISVTATGNYSVTVTNANGCSSNCSKSVTFYPNPNCTIAGNRSFCPGGSSQLCAAPASSYLWSTGETTQCITVNQVRNYTLTVSNGYCESTCSASIALSRLDDDNECTIDFCDPSTGITTHTPVVIDDQNACTYDACDSLTGNISNTANWTQDANLCNIESCDPLTGNVSSAVNWTQDANLCDVESCDPLTGIVSSAVNWTQDANLCDIESCDPLTGIVSSAVNWTQDANLCDIESCDPLTGNVSSTVNWTQDANLCDIESCDPLTGNVSSAVNWTQDANLCDIESCDPLTGNVSSTVNWTQDANLCDVESCDPLTGNVSSVVNWTQDANLCDIESCDPLTGNVSSVVNWTQDANLCDIESCDPLTGNVSSVVNWTQDANLCDIESCDPLTGNVSSTVNWTQDANLCDVESCDPLTGNVSSTVNWTQDANLCDVESCDPLTGIVSSTVTWTQDANLCDIESCDPLTGNVSSTVNWTQDANLCDIESCDPLTGNVSSTVNWTQDANLCDVESCDPLTGNVSSTVNWTQDANLCDIESCDPLTGNVSSTVNWTQDANLCDVESCDPLTGNVSSVVTWTQDANLCDIESCDPLTGNVSSTVNWTQDANLCDIESCDPLTGLVTHTSVVTDDSNVCTTDACEPSTGDVTHTPLNTDDNNVCTTDGCDPLTGIYNNAISFDDNNVCTTDACDPIDGVSHTPVNIDDNNACTIDACDPVNGVTHVSNPPSCSINGSGTCCGEDPLQLCVPYTTAPRTYLWSTGETKRCIIVTTSNNYFVTVTDGNGCSVTCNKEVTFHPFPNCEISCNNTICPNSTSMLSGPAGMVHYTWSTGATTRNITINAPGTYTLTVSNGHCESTCTKVVTLSVVDDNNACTTDACDPSTGEVTHTQVNTDDNNECTSDNCDPINGVTHTLVNVDDNNACTNDACDPATGIITNITNWTQDANLCDVESCDPLTGNVSSTVTWTQDANLCDIESCDPLTGNVSSTVNWTQDANLCDIESCDPLTGNVSSTVNWTQDANLCDIESCDPLTGNVSSAVNWTQDANLCDIESCDPLTGNVSSTVNWTQDANLCDVESCDPLTGNVSSVVNWTQDANLCDVESCDPLTGNVSSVVNWTQDANLCDIESCDPLTGNVSSVVNWTQDANLCDIESCDPLTGNVSSTVNWTQDANLCDVESCDPLTGNVSSTVNWTQDANLCDVESCDPLTGIVSSTVTWTQDANLCDIESCDPLTGNVSSTVNWTQDANLCDIESCDPLTGNVSSTVNWTQDANLCDVESCDPLTGNVSSTVNWTQDANLCDIESCDPLTGNVSSTVNWTQDANLCDVESCDPLTGNVSSVVTWTQDANLCDIESCDPLTGNVSSTVNWTQDANLCDIESCDPLTGLVTHTSVVTDDSNVCTTDACEPSTGDVTHTPLNTDDNNVCTTDGCDPLTGIYNNAISFDDNNVCTTDACDPIDGVSHTPVNIDDNNACTIDACDPVNGVTHVSNPPSCSINGSGTCCGEDPLQLCVPYTTAPRTYLWSTGETKRCIIVTTSNNYFVTVTDGNGCSVTCNKEVTFHPFPNCEISCNNTICPNSTSMLSGPAGMVHYTWSTGATTRNITINAPGTYTLTVSNGHCESTCTKVVTLSVVDDNNACTTDACDPSTGEVTHTQVNTDDNNECTSDNCDPINGVTHTLVNVDDNNACTNDACDPATGIITNITNWTQDANLCDVESCDPLTGNVSSTVTWTQDANLCDIESCDPLTGNVSSTVNWTQDANLCDIESCDPLTGNVSSTVNWTQDANLCDVESCDPLTGNVSSTVNWTQDANLCDIESCDPLTGNVSSTVNWTQDANLCDVESCDPLTGNVSSTVNWTQDANLCDVESCDPLTGNVSSTVNWTQDANLCDIESCDPLTGNVSSTVNWTQDANLCDIESCDPLTGNVSSVVTWTQDANLCDIESCDPLTGNVSSTVNWTQDANLCDIESCDPLTGLVTHTSVVTDDSNVCTTDACEPSTGDVTHTPLNTDDNNVCTTDGCDPLTGIYNNAISFDDNNVCTTDACDPSNGVSHNQVSIDDNNECTLDACDPIGGITHTTVSIDDQNECTVDACNPLSGQVTHVTVNVDDNIACTVDACDPISGVITHIGANAPANPVIVGNNAPCVGTVVTYYATGATGATNYVWTVPAGVILNSPQGRDSIVVTIATNCLPGNISVTASNLCGNSGNVTLWLNVINTVPTISGSINGLIEGVCSGSTVQYCIASIPGVFNYAWTIPAKTVILSGSGTNCITISIQAGFTSGTLSVRAQNCKGLSSTKSLTIRSLPMQPGTIIGETTNLCRRTGVSYSVAAIAGATSYSWILPAGATISSGTGTNSIIVDFGISFTSGNISVCANNGCGTGPSRSLSVKANAAIPSVINGSNTVCANDQSVAYSVASQPGVTYTWTVPTGATITSGQGTPNITVNFGVSSGNVTVKPVNLCGAGLAFPLAVTVNACTRLSNDSPVENKIELMVYPNPVKSDLFVEFNLDKVTEYTIAINDVTGREVYHSKQFSIQGNNKQSIKVDGFMQGVYLFIVKGENLNKSVRIIVD